MSIGKAEQSGKSTQLNPDMVAGYFNKINQLSGGKLNNFATNGTQSLTNNDIRAVGGQGATRELKTNTLRQQSLNDIMADPSLTVAQKQRAKQLTDQQAQANLDAIAKETEAGLTNVKLGQQANSRADLETLARIFFGGKGSNSQSSGTSYNVGFSK